MDICELFNVSVQTIRKDLNDLSDRGLVKRVHGGITLPVANQNASFNNRKVINLEQKRLIALSVAKAIPEGSSLFLGIGTTPQQIAEALLDHKMLMIVTNNLNVAMTLCQHESIETYLCGGKLRPSDQDLMGEDATDFLNKFHLDFGIFGVGGISENGTLMDFSLEESQISKTIMANCNQRFLVADKSKYCRHAPIKTAHLRDINRFFTDTLPESLSKICDKLDIDVTESQEHA
jgi:DeoR family glycerol-3-phosphate regulon repressor